MGDPPVGAGSDAQVVLAAPIDEIVARAGGVAAGVVGHLVGGKPLAGQDFLGCLVEYGRQVGVGGGEGLAPHGPVEGRAGFDGQLVGRDVLGAEVERGQELRRPGLGSLAGSGIDQVHRQAGEQAGGQAGGAAGLAGEMVAAEKFQGDVVQRLHAQGEPVDPGGGEGGEAAGLRVGGIGLERHLQIRRGPQSLGHTDDLGDQGRVHQRGRAAAEEDRDQGALADLGRLRLQVRQYGLAQRRALAGPPVQGHVEVAVGADPRAVGPVHIEAQRRGDVVRGPRQTAPP